MSELPPFTTVNLKGSDTTPSLLYNNLAALDEWVAYIHKSEVVVANISAADNPVVSHPLSGILEKNKTGAYQVKAVDIMGVPTLLAATQCGIILWDLAKEKVLASVFLSESSGDIFLSRGIAVVEQRSSALILVGHSDGSISALDYNGSELAVAKTLKQHKDSITDINAGQADGVGFIIASADSAGEIIVWSEELEVMGTMSVGGYVKKGEF